MHLNSAALNAIALQYGPPLGTGGTVDHRRIQLAEYIGMRVPL